MGPRKRGSYVVSARVTEAEATTPTGNAESEMLARMTYHKRKTRRWFWLCSAINRAKEKAEYLARPLAKLHANGKRTEPICILEPRCW